mmetsp:Transcript_10748/g.16853  ORF Transcript_10748/g.16853 Transcript_10748/m.16853 type:complete len:206 (-) Transcript_10748:672-1289(-)
MRTTLAEALEAERLGSLRTLRLRSRGCVNSSGFRGLRLQYGSIDAAIGRNSILGSFRRALAADGDVEVLVGQLFQSRPLELEHASHPFFHFFNNFIPLRGNTKLSNTSRLEELIFMEPLQKQAYSSFISETSVLEESLEVVHPYGVPSGPMFNSSTQDVGPGPTVNNGKDMSNRAVPSVCEVRILDLQLLIVVSDTHICLHNDGQ